MNEKYTFVFIYILYSSVTCYLKKKVKLFEKYESEYIQDKYVQILLL